MTFVKSLWSVVKDGLSFIFGLCGLIALVFLASVAMGA